MKIKLYVVIHLELKLIQLGFSSKCDCNTYQEELRRHAMGSNIAGKIANLGIISLVYLIMLDEGKVEFPKSKFQYTNSLSADLAKMYKQMCSLFLAHHLWQAVILYSEKAGIRARANCQKAES